MAALKSYYVKGRLEAGCDEAGRGCLAGPVFAAAVILPERFRCPGLNDSKQVSPEERERMRMLIERDSIAWAVASLDARVIDRINILRASIQAMHNALRVLTIAAASILAKTHRDAYMRNMHVQFPHYGWDQNKGYATELHRTSITIHGITDEHRRSFKYVGESASQLELFE